MEINEGGMKSHQIVIISQSPNKNMNSIDIEKLRQCAQSMDLEVHVLDNNTSVDGLETILNISKDYTREFIDHLREKIYRNSMINDKPLLIIPASNLNSIPVMNPCDVGMLQYSSPCSLLDDNFRISEIKETKFDGKIIPNIKLKYMKRKKR